MRSRSTPDEIEDPLRLLVRDGKLAGEFVWLELEVVVIDKSVRSRVIRGINIDALNLALV